jgi:hypothetical protein
MDVGPVSESRAVATPPFYGSLLRPAARDRNLLSRRGFFRRTQLHRGVALACFANYAWQNSDGDVLVVDAENVASFIEVQDCISITIAVDVVAATAMGGWIFYPVT